MSFGFKDPIVFLGTRGQALPPYGKASLPIVEVTTVTKRLFNLISPSSLSNVLKHLKLNNQPNTGI